MNYNVLTIPLFDKQSKRLAKKYSSLKYDLADLIKDLTTNPLQGSPLGNNFFKIRIVITSKRKGKSGGARVITFVKIVQTTIYLTSIYDKSEKAAITAKELELIFNKIP